MTAGLGTVNTKFISSPARKGWGSAVLVSQRSSAPSPPPPSCWATAPWASWLPGPSAVFSSPGPGANPALCPLSAVGGSFLGGRLQRAPGQAGVPVAHALGTGIMICALLVGGGGGVLGGLGASLGPGASKVRQVRNRVAVAASTEEEESFQSCGFKGTGNASTRQAPAISPCLGVREHGMDSDVTWRRPLPGG